MSALRIAPNLAIDTSLISERFTHASGPGGQNVNKVATAVILRFDAKHAALPFEIHARLEALAGSRLTKDGAVVIRASQYRDQQRNREDARERLIALLREAATLPKKRRATKPTRSSKEKRLEKKKVHSRLKQTRAKRFDD
ncbi:MAG: alternative ribosome rescue aminoacyl-tRNA hydrolase ArfB [Rhizomicrobium sp.]